MSFTYQRCACLLIISVTAAVLVLQAILSDINIPNILNSATQGHIFNTNYTDNIDIDSNLSEANIISNLSNLSSTSNQTIESTFHPVYIKKSAKDQWLKLTNNAELIHSPGADKNHTIYVLNTIYLPRTRSISIFLLAKMAWKDQTLSYDKSKMLLRVDKGHNGQVSCIFPTNISTKVVMVPRVLYKFGFRNTLQILMCNIPKSINLLDENNIIHDFLLRSYDRRINFRLQYNIYNRSMFPINTKYDISNHGNKSRFLSMCIPQVLGPVPFMAENIAYYISQGIEHIYIGTYFHNRYLYSESVHRYKTSQLINLLKPWYDNGQITLINMIAPQPIRLSVEHHGQAQFNIQCLYLAKSFGDEFTINTDMDEYIVFNNGLTIYENLKSEKYLKDISTNCWTVFDGFDVWKLTNVNAPYMTQRFTEISTMKSHITNRCKTLWNNKYLWSAEVHTGGACNINTWHWEVQIKDYKEEYRDINEYNPKSLVRIMDAKHEASIRHFINAYRIRPEFEFFPKKYTFHDPAIPNIIGKSITSELSKHNGYKYDYYVNNSNKKFNVLCQRYYIDHYGYNSSMNIIIKPNYTNTYNEMDDEIIVPSYQ